MSEKLNFFLPIRAMSYNHYIAQTKTGRRFISNKGRTYYKELCSHLEPFENDLKHFGSNVSWPTMFNLNIKYFYIDYFTKKNEHSKKCNDVDNPNKIIIDTIFSTMGLDDYLLKELTCSKHYTITSDMVLICLTKYIDQI